MTSNTRRTPDYLAHMLEAIRRIEARRDLPRGRRADIPGLGPRGQGNRAHLPHDATRQDPQLLPRPLSPGGAGPARRPRLPLQQRGAPAGDPDARPFRPPRRGVEQPARGPRAEHAQPAPAAELHGSREHAYGAAGACPAGVEGVSDRARPARADAAVLDAGEPLPTGGSSSTSMPASPPSPEPKWPLVTVVLVQGREKA